MPSADTRSQGQLPIPTLQSIEGIQLLPSLEVTASNDPTTTSPAPPLRAIPILPSSTPRNRLPSFSNSQKTLNPASRFCLKATASGMMIAAELIPLANDDSVNYPFFTSATNASCVDSPFYHTRLTGGADVDKAIYNATSKTFTYANIVPDGANTCINGDCSLPGETSIVHSGCRASVSVFTVDYDAPATSKTAKVRSALSPLVEKFNGSVSFPFLVISIINPNSTTYGVTPMKARLTFYVSCS